MVTSQPANKQKQPFSEHIRELRRRLFVIVAVLLAGTSVGYYLHEHILRILQKPLGQTLFYTSPTGGFNFVIKLALLFGVIVTIPVFVYQLGKFLEPVIADKTRYMFAALAMWSSALGVMGILFAYFVSLPGALKFLTNFGGGDIQSLITVDAYFNFVVAYLLGCALLFQIPLIVLFVNRIKPLGPGKMMKFQRFVILISFILAAIITPTPDPINQAIMASPAIVFYQASIGMVMVVNKRKARTRYVVNRQTAYIAPRLTERPLPAVPKPQPVATARPASSYSRVHKRTQGPIQDVIRTPKANSQVRPVLRTAGPEAPVSMPRPARVMDIVMPARQIAT